MWRGNQDSYQPERTAAVALSSPPLDDGRQNSVGRCANPPLHQKGGTLILGFAILALISLTACTGPISHLDTAPSRSPAATADLTVTGPAQDLGPRTHASGIGTEVSAGVFTYEIAENDTLGTLAERFDICLADLYAANDSLRPGHEDDISIGLQITVEFINGANVDGADHSGYRCRNMP